MWTSVGELVLKKKPLHTTVVKVFATSKGSTQPPDVQIGEIRLDYFMDGEVATLVSGAPATLRRVLEVAQEATDTRTVVRKPRSDKPSRRARGRFGEYLVAVLSGSMFGALWRWGGDHRHDEPPPDGHGGEDHGGEDSFDDHDFEYHDVGLDYFDGGGGL